MSNRRVNQGNNEFGTLPRTEAQLRNIAKASKRNRSAKTGEFVSDEMAAAHPDMTVTETITAPDFTILDYIAETELGILADALKANTEPPPVVAQWLREIERRIDLARD